MERISKRKAEKLYNAGNDIYLSTSKAADPRYMETINNSTDNRYKRYQLVIAPEFESMVFTFRFWHCSSRETVYYYTD